MIVKHIKSVNILGNSDSDFQIHLTFVVVSLVVMLRSALEDFFLDFSFIFLTMDDGVGFFPLFLFNIFSFATSSACFENCIM